MHLTYLSTDASDRKTNVRFVIRDPGNPLKRIFYKKNFFFENFWRPIARPRGAQIENFLHRGIPTMRGNDFCVFWRKKIF